MSEFHYVRTLGEDGGVDAINGAAEGMSLEEILKDGLPPYKVVLEVLSALCEILDIAEQDEELHGDINVSRVFIDDVGAVSLEGYGVERAKCDCPEGSLKGPATDIYGLGRVAYALFTPRDFPELVNDDPDAHDDAVIDAVIQINFDGLPEDMVGDIQWFLCKFLSFDREDRPNALDAWRTFIAFADEVEGELIEHWSVDALEGGGERRDRDAAMTRDLNEGDEAGEELGGPSIKKGPLSKGAISFGGGGGGKSGQATAFWSKDAMKAALEAEEEEEDDGFKPQVGGGAATSFWTKEQLQSMREGKGDAPRPKRGGSGGGDGERLSERPQTMFMAPPKREDKPKPPPPPPPKTPKAPPPTMPPQPIATPTPASVEPTGPVSKPSAGITGPGPAITGPSASGTGGPGSLPAQQPRPAEPESEGGGKGLIIAAIVVVLLILLCGGVFLLGGAGYVFMGSAESPAEGSEAVVDMDDDDEDEAFEEEDEPSEPVEEAPDTKSNETASSRRSSSSSANRSGSSSSRRSASSGTRSSSSSSSSASRSSSRSSSSAGSSTASSSRSGRSSTSSSRRTKTPEPTPVAAAPSGPARVKIKITGTGKLSCTEGTSRPIDGIASLTFEEYKLPVSCRVEIKGQGPCIVYAEKSATCTCSPGNPEAKCV